MMRALGLIYILLFCVSCDTDPYPGYTALDAEGLYFKVISFDDEEQRPQHGDRVRFKMSMYTSDTLWWTTDQVQVIAFDTLAIGLKSELHRFHKGDSIAILMEPSALWKEFGFLENRSADVTDVHMKVIDIIPYDTWYRSTLIEEKEKEELEEALISAYMDTCSYAQEFEFRGEVLWRIRTPCTGGRYPWDTELRLRYVAMLMDGTVIDDRSSAADALSYKLGMQGQIISGLELVVRQIQQGEQVEVILPSHLAFGEDGSIGGVVPPWHPVRFILQVDIEQGGA